MPDDDDRPRDASGAAGANRSDPDAGNLAWANAVAPDDISELTRDIRDYHRERRAERRREISDRITNRRGATPVMMTLAALAIAGLIAVLLTVLEPGTKAQGPSPLRLASTVIAPGQVNGLVPKVTLRTATHASISTQDPRLRPGVIALIPASCDCVNTLEAVASQAAMVNLRVFVVAPSSDADTDALSGQIGTNATVYYDSTGALAAAENAAGLSTTGVTLLLENRDGTIYTRQPNATATTTSGLNQSLEDMLNPTGTRG